MEEVESGVVGQSTTGWLDLGPTFIRRVAITTAWVGLIVSLLLAVYVGGFKALSHAAGVVLGIADLLLLHGLIRETLQLRRKSALAVFFVLKFFVLYAVGAVLLVLFRFPPLFLILGFSLFLIVVFLKILGRLFLSTRWMQQERKGAGGPVLRKSPGERGAGS